MAIGLIAALLVAAAGYWFFTAGPGWSIISPRGATVAQFAGEGDQTTTAFRVRGGWRIEWESTGERFAMSVTGDQNLGTVIDVEGPDSGLTAPPTAGTFQVQVRGSGPWTIKILQGR